MSFHYSYKTHRGIVKIVPTSGRFNIIYNDENLGSYHSAAAAADDASGGHTFSPSNGVDLGDLDIPGDIGEWETVRSAA